MKKRLLAMIMALAMMLSLLPMSALAEGEASAQQANLTPANTVVKHSDGTTLATLSKTAEDKGNGTYDVTLSVTASEVIESQPVEIVLVLDSSGSMAWCTSDAEIHEHKNNCYSNDLICTKDVHQHNRECISCSNPRHNSWDHGPECFNCGRDEHYHSRDNGCYAVTCGKVEHTHEGGGTECSMVPETGTRMSIVKAKAIEMLSDIADIGGNVKVAVVDFDSKASTACGLTAVTEANIAENGPLVTAINGMVAEGGTQPQNGLSLANSVLGQGDQYAKKVVILLADGEADNQNAANSAINTAATMKSNGIEIFTIGFKTDATMLSGIATDAEHYATADSAVDLEAIFDKIVRGLAAMILDPMGSYVDLQGGANGVAVSLDGTSYAEGLVVTQEEQIEWNKQGGLTKTQTVTLNYTVKLNESDFLANHDAGTHIVALNGDARLNYSYMNQGGRASFPLPTAEVGIGQLTTKVMLDGETVHSSVAGNEIIVYPDTNANFSWELPAAEINVNGDTYVYVDSTYDGTATTATSAPVTAGAHTLIHNYVKVVPKGNLTITKAVSGLLDNDTLPQDFKITVTGPNGYTNDLNLSEAVDGSSYTWNLNDLTPGEYTVTESNYNVTGYNVNATGNGTVTATVVDKQTVTAALTNAYTPATYNVTYEYTNDAPEGALAASVNNTTAQYKSEVTVANEPSVDGYTFSGWSTTDAGVSDGKFSMPAKDVKLTGFWSANTDTKYTVEHYKQELNGTYPESASESETLTGTTGETATATPKNYAGFTHALNAQGTIESGEITGDGNLVLKLYYTRNAYNVVYQITGSHFTNENFKTQSGILFESPLSLIEDNMAQGGYVWSGWTGLPTTMPDHDVIVTGSYTAATDTAYKVEHYKQNLDGTDYDLADTDNLTGTTGATATAIAKTYTGFTFDESVTGTVKSGAIAADGGLVLKLFYTRNTYDIVYKVTGDYFVTDSYKTVNGVKFGAELTQITDDMAKQGYEWSGWTGLPATMPANNVTVTGSYTAATGTAYIVEHYKQNLDGSYPETASETENLTGTTGATATASAKTYVGFTFDEDVTGTVKSGTIAPDGSLVLKLFYTRNTYDIVYKVTGDYFVTD
ncbi:MAG: VWA domain-containing protein, partial [Ruminiclostridium sp.]|nr:VWA domain-containing protein [Ruminiclostridium sp.]